jgi:hypothetical protein
MAADMAGHLAGHLAAVPRLFHRFLFQHESHRALFHCHDITLLGPWRGRTTAGFGRDKAAGTAGQNGDTRCVM